ncbi:MAG: NAD-dependent epimerase/dehydratase family protein [Acidimicrobiales bacterium]
MRALVTGVAGFIGSHLAEQLLAEGHSVRGIDCFTPYYDPAAKRANVEGLGSRTRFELVEADLRVAELEPLLSSIDTVFHQSAQPGVRLSWSDGFAQYVENNIAVTQRLLEAVRHQPVGRVVYASSSSIYGNAAAYPSTETDVPRPHSPYGVTKLAAEHLCGLYGANWGVPTVALRYFTVYGPRQRPDMATYRLIEAALGPDEGSDGPAQAFPLYGDGTQVRDFTYVGDVVAANLAAARAHVAAGTVINVAGGSSCTLAQLVDLVGGLVGRDVPLGRRPAQPGDVARTGGSIDRAADLLGWKPQVDLRAGVARQVEWHVGRRAASGRARA